MATDKETLEKVKMELEDLDLFIESLEKAYKKKDDVYVINNIENLKVLDLRIKNIIKSHDAKEVDDE